MALLPNLAKRLNDIEISSSAPITESLMRKFGSNVNLLLDFLGINDDSSTATGDLSDLVNALSIVSNHTMNLLYNTTTTPAIGNQVIATLNSVKYVNQIIIAASGVDVNFFNPYGQSGATSSETWYMTKRRNGSLPDLFSHFESRFESGSNKQYDPQGAAMKGYATANGNDVASGDVNFIQNRRNDFTNVNFGLVTADIRLPKNRQWLQVAELDWREANSWELRHWQTTGQASFGSAPISYYRAYKLNIESAGLIY